MAADGLHALLDELERRLRAFGAPIADAFRPGAAPGHVRDALEQERVRAHEDLVAWWTWHDGAELVPPPDDPPIPPDVAENMLVGPWHVVSLAESIAFRRWRRNEYEALGMGDLIPASWVPVLVAGEAGELWANVDVEGAAPLQIRDEGYLGGEPPHVASLDEFVRMAIRAFDEGLVGPDPGGTRAPWIGDAALQTDLRRLIIW